MQEASADGAALANELTPLFAALIRAGDASSKWRALTSTQRQLLFELHNSGPLRLGTLADRVGTTDPTASRAVDGLVAEGLVERKADRSDRRAVLHEATRRGRALAEARRAEVVAALDAALAGLELAERRKLLAVLAKLNAQLRDLDSRTAVFLDSQRG